MPIGTVTVFPLRLPSHSVWKNIPRITFVLKKTIFEIPPLEERSTFWVCTRKQHKYHVRDPTTRRALHKLWLQYVAVLLDKNILEAPQLQTLLDCIPRTTCLYSKTAFWRCYEVAPGRTHPLLWKATMQVTRPPRRIVFVREIVRILHNPS